jgi:hypothetical protein
MVIIAVRLVRLATAMQLKVYAQFQEPDAQEGNEGLGGVAADSELSNLGIITIGAVSAP